MKALRIIVGILGILLCLFTLFTSVEDLLTNENYYADDFSTYSPLITETLITVGCTLLASIICLNQKIGYFGMLVAVMVIYYLSTRTTVEFCKYVYHLMYALLLTGAFVKGFSPNKK